MASKKERRKRRKKKESLPQQKETPGVKPEVTIVRKEEPSFERPSISEPKMISDEDRVVAYLKEHGASGPARIARILGMEWTAVMKALRKLRDEGKISLR